MSKLYDQTRQSWEDIWENASVEVEIAALKEKRTDDQLGVFPAYLSKEGTILEAGCGLGAVMFALRDMGFQMMGLDYAENALHTLRAYEPAIPVQAGDVHALPYADNSLHGYLSFGVLEHFEHGPGPALREANRVLVPGGVIVLTIPYPNVVH
ncbi:MAG: class I SAM-dependent methyltransferase, partial [Anaerolineae bacterium]|nr:class I SAM-dependent methyltransferase [Anaerolineae bacterium]